MNVFQPGPILDHSKEQKKYIDQVLQLVQGSHEFDFIGNLSLIHKVPIGFTGSRQTSEFNQSRIYKLSKALSQKRTMIISGGARGTDEAAHSGALDARDGSTLIFPPLSLYDLSINERFSSFLHPENLEKLLLLSSFDPDQKNYTSMPLIRNELIAAFSGVCIIGQTGSKGGTLSTLNHCRAMGTRVFYLRPTDSCSKSWKDSARMLESVAEAIDWDSESELKVLADKLINIAEETQKEKVRKAQKQLHLF